MPSTSEPALTSLFAQIEHAWKERGDTQLVEKLADRHPQHAQDLFAFFDAILSDEDDLPAGAGAAAVRGTHEWLKEELATVRAEGTSPRSSVASASGPSPPGDLLQFLCVETGKSPAAVVSGMDDTTMELMVMFSQYPTLVPDGARQVFALKAQRGHGVDPRRTRRKFEDAPPLARAASRTGVYDTPPGSYEELLDRAALPSDLRARWLAFAEDADSQG